MDSILIAMILALLIPMYEACRNDDIWQQMLAFGSIATKTSIIMLFIAVLRDDCSDALRVTRCNSEADGCAVIEDEYSEPVQAKCFGE